MNRPSFVLIIGAISLLSLVGCNSDKVADTQTSPEASQGSSVGATGSQSGFNSLLGVVSNTKAAVEAGNFAKAKDEFNKFEGNWNKVEDGVKAKSPTSYKAIEDNADQVNGELKASTPNKAKVLTALQSLQKNINSVTK